MKRILVIGKNGLVGKQFFQASAGKYELLGIGRQDHLSAVQGPVDVILFLAQSADYKNAVFTQDLLQVNVGLLRDTLEQFRGRARQFIFFSSGSVYQSVSHPIEEKDPLAYQTQNPYVASKIMAEILVQTFAKHFEAVSIVRPFFIYGKNQNQNMLFSRLIQQLKAGEEIAIGQEGGLLFNPVYVKDVVSFIEFLIEQSSSGLQYLNIAGPEVISLQQVIEWLAEILQKKPHLCLKDWPLNKLIGKVTYPCHYKVYDGLREMLRD